MEIKKVRQFKYSRKELSNGIPNIAKYANVVKRGEDYYKSIENKPYKIIFTEDFVDTVMNIYQTAGGPASFRGPLAIFNELKDNTIGISRRDIEGVLKNSESQQVFSVALKPKVTRPIIVSGPLKQWATDLIFVNNSQDERLFTVLTVIDMFTKHAWCEIVSTDEGQKYTAQSVLSGFKKIFSKEGSNLPSVIRSDNGNEFKNKKVSEYFKSLGITQLFSRSYTPTDNAMSERFNKTIKIMIGKYLNSTNGEVVNNDELQNLVKSYNSTVHSSTGKRPLDIHPGKSKLSLNQRGDIELEVLEKNKERVKRIMNDNAVVYPPIRKGDIVRIHKRVTGEWRKATQWKSKVYKAQYSYELYKVAFVSRPKERLSEQIELRDSEGHLIPRKFVRPDLLKVNKAELIKELSPNEFVVAKIHNKKIVRGKPLFLVSWSGWPPDVQNWIAPSDSFGKLIADYEKAH